MGSLSNIVAFDYKEYKKVVIPSLKDGESNKLIRSEIEIQNGYLVFNSKTEFKNLSRVIEQFNDDLSSCKYDKLFAVNESGIVKTDKVFERPKNTLWGYEDLASLFEPFLLKHCAKYFLSLGKIYSFELLLFSQETRTQELLNKWDRGASIWQHCDGGFGEGISGWLTNLEVKELNKNIDTLELKTDRYNQSGDIIESLKGIIQIASDNDLGLLYGNDLRMNFRPHFQYCLLLELERDKEKNWDGNPTFENQIIKDYR